METVFFPLDQALQLPATGPWSLTVRSEVAREAATSPSYAQAAANYSQMTGVHLSTNSAWRIVLEAGGRVGKQEEAQIHAAQEEQAAANAAFWAGEEGKVKPRAEPSHPIMAELKDGTTIHLRAEGWKEVKVALVTGVATKTIVSRAGEQKSQVYSTQPSYRAGLWSAEELGLQAWSEGQRRGVDRAKTLLELGDGAAWIWNLNAAYHPEAVEIVDWYHASEHLWDVARGVVAGEEWVWQDWAKQQEALLWEGDIEGVLTAMEALSPRNEEARTLVRQNLNYFRTNKERMRYQRYRALGYLIGSGSIEGGGCKNLVGGRMKLAGMRWSRNGANAMLCLRSKLLSGRWEEVWKPAKPVLAKAA